MKLRDKIWPKRGTCGACGHAILIGRPDCPDCNRIADENPDEFTPCAQNK